MSDLYSFFKNLPFIKRQLSNMSAGLVRTNFWTPHWSQSKYVLPSCLVT